MADFTVPKGWVRGELVNWTPIKNGAMWRITQKDPPPKPPHDVKDERILSMEIARDELFEFREWWNQ